MQEVRASTEDLQELLGDEWDILHDPATAKGRAGVAIASRNRASIHRVELGAPDFDSAGRWLEADYEVGDRVVTVVSAYVHSGEVDTPKQVEKYRFLDAMEARLPELAAHSELALVVGDLNVGHRTLDIRNWKGNVKRAGFLPTSAPTSTASSAPRATTTTTAAAASAGSTSAVASPARSTDRTPGGHGAARRSTTTPDGASTTSSPPRRWPTPPSTYTVDRAATYDARFSDHAPVVVDYAI